MIKRTSGVFLASTCVLTYVHVHPHAPIYAYTQVNKVKIKTSSCYFCGCCCLRPLLSLLLLPRLQGRKYTNDVAKIYSINVTNVMGGVASYCRPCALEASDLGSSCTSCPAGHYIDRDSGTCHLCPPNTILKAHQPYGAQACVACGPGTKNNKVTAVCHTW